MPADSNDQGNGGQGNGGQGNGGQPNPPTQPTPQDPGFWTNLIKKGDDHPRETKIEQVQQPTVTRPQLPTTTREEN